MFSIPVCFSCSLSQCVSGQVIILLTHFDTISTAELVLVCWFVVWLSGG